MTVQSAKWVFDGIIGRLELLIDVLLMPGNSANGAD